MHRFHSDAGAPPIARIRHAESPRAPHKIITRFA
jgi:hypothetical protein